MAGYHEIDIDVDKYFNYLNNLLAQHYSNIFNQYTNAN